MTPQIGWSAKRDAMFRKKSYTYDDAGNLVGLQKADGDVIFYTHDKVNRLIQIAFQSGPSVSFEYDPNGNRTAMEDGLGGSTWQYDSMNRMIGYTDPFGKQVGYSYDAKGNRTRIVYPGNHAVSYTFDSADRLVSVEDWFGNTTNYAYDLGGRVQTVGNLNGTSASFGYGSNSWLTSLSNKKSDGTLL